MAQKFCIFCGQRGLTKEHFWPDWLGKQISKNEVVKYIEGSIQATPKEDDAEETVNTRSGSVATKKFRVVCATCNNGWMSALEEKVKPIIQNAIAPCNMKLEKEQLQLFSKWITMKTMLAEHTKLGSNSILKEDLKIFYDKQTVPEYFKIYVAKHDTNQVCAYSRTSVRLGTVATAASHIGKNENNTQATSFLLGQLFIYVFSTTDPSLNILGDFKLNRLKRIKPNESMQLCFKSLKTLDQHSIQSVVYALEDFINSPSCSINTK
ncbi:hypothetical protein UA38_01710 [Photobacterium kishitanii]|uniref:HNH endonuclease n=1 Tax=Photobacterium kishitanii TaxID=318456 RepID=A0AAX0Z1N3_9GAMM|nr:hypothetical protein [Photobacterium kishitanii]KJG59888.1 hypothetical protein UA38_01710 [Photobacterium kishitanii]KJG63171.1 hypothetical protein UA42_02095 [Photobacterium kishitanii]KJG67819.1 hypothetical protein UA40_00750 [Photobacterium kishitanii]KJG71342.1 hypothetical protein UA41_01725 [Photobacterium kishitanii]PSX20317.1 hypothetical protein C0W70_05450 [Photobacterium kishitanii]